jgi:hypothetical protein
MEFRNISINRNTYAVCVKNITVDLWDQLQSCCTSFQAYLIRVGESTNDRVRAKHAELIHSCDPCFVVTEEL